MVDAAQETVTQHRKHWGCVCVWLDRIQAPHSTIDYFTYNTEGLIVYSELTCRRNILLRDINALATKTADFIAAEHLLSMFHRANEQASTSIIQNQD